MILWIYETEPSEGAALAVGVSALHQNPSELPTAAREAIQAENRNFYEDSNLSVYGTSRPDEFCSIHSEYMPDLYHFENCMKIWEFEEAKKSIKALFSKLKVDLTRAFEVKNICTQIYYICSKILLKKELPSLGRELFLEIEDCTTIGQLELLVERMLEEESALLLTQGKPMGLLTDTDALAYEAAEQVSFKDPACFSAIFKKYTGMSPKEYKLGQRKQEKEESR